MGKCQSQESARDYAPDQLPVVEEPTSSPAAEASLAVEEPVAPLDIQAAADKPCITKQSLNEMPANAADLEENEQISIFSNLLVKNLIVQECAIADQDEKDEEIEIKAKAMAVLHQVIWEECKKMDDAEAVVGTAEQTHVEEVQVSDDIAVKADAKVAELKTISEDAQLEKNADVVEAKMSSLDDPTKNEETACDSCAKCKGTGKTNMMGGTRGFSFMKRQCKYCSPETISKVAKAGA